MMRMNVIEPKKLAFIVCGFFGILLIALIIGITGPSSKDSIVFSAFDCPDGSHTWSAGCKGIRPSYNEIWSMEFSPIRTANRFWTLEITPITLNTDPIHPDVIPRPITAEISVWGRKKAGNDAVWQPVVVNEQMDELLKCYSDRIYCNSFMIVYVDHLEYSIYRVSLKFPDLGGKNSPVGDMEFTYFRGNAQFSNLQTGILAFFLIVSVSIFSYYLYRLINIPQQDLSFEQKAMIFLLFAVVLYNNPFFAMKYAVNGWFFTFLDAFFDVIFQTAIFCYWKCSLRKIILDDTSSVFIKKSDWWRYIEIAVYSIFALIIFSWVNIRHRIDPIYGISSSSKVLNLFITLTIIIFVKIVVTCIIYAHKSIHVVKTKPYLRTKLFFLIFPSGLLLIAIFGGLFSGGFVGFVESSSIEMMLFTSVFNLYVFFLTWACWPAKSGYGIENPSIFPTKASADVEKTQLIK